MQATIITIGDEILIGQVVDTNSTYIANELNKIGVRVHHILSISDTEESITNALDNAVKTSDIVLLTGGLGPTKDDITKHALAKYFKCGMLRHLPTLEIIEKRLGHLGVKMSEINRAQADIPEKCNVLNNNSGSAPGMLFNEGGKVVVSMPGVPFEMKDIMQSGVIPYLESNFKLPFRLHKTFLTVGVPESTLSDKLEHFEANLPTKVSLAYLPSPGRVRLRLSAFGNTEEEVKEVFSIQSTHLKDNLGESLFGYDKETLESVLGDLLAKNKLTIATAESCTGGNVAKVITSVPGASRYFKGGIVAYSNEIKEQFLGVSGSNLNIFGAVSQQVVEQMAENVKVQMSADIGIATSGISGPTGGAADKPIGTVWIGVSTPQRTFALKFSFGNNRERTVIRTTVTALNLVRKEINSIVKKTVNKV